MGRPMFFVLKHHGMEFYGFPGMPFGDKQGRLIKELTGWKLTSLSSNYVLLSNETEDALFELNQK